MIITALVVVGVLVLGGGALGGYAWNNSTYAARDLQAALHAGFVEHSTTVPSGTVLNYAEGPDNGPAVLLIHAQTSSWESYARALPALAADFHVYAIDVAGHGDSARTPGRYTVHDIGQDVVDFLTDTIADTVILSGHSSGGLIAAWVAAEAPELVEAVLLEDPPLFSTEAARMPQQFNYIDLAQPAHEFLASDETDFAAYYLANNAWIGHFGQGKDGIVRYAADYRAAHPDEPLNLWFLPPVSNESYAHMHEFDPAFADAFYDLSWQADFDQAATLAAITQPSILVHADWRITDDGILEGAMTDDVAALACNTLVDCSLVRVQTGHGYHFEDPDGFVGLIEQLNSELSGA